MAYWEPQGRELANCNCPSTVALPVRRLQDKGGARRLRPRIEEGSMARTTCPASKSRPCSDGGRHKAR